MRLKSIFTNSFGILFSRVTGLGRDVVMASALGASIYTDIFFVAFKLPNLFRRIFAEGAFTQAFMPSFVSSKRKGVFAVSIFLHFVIILMGFSIFVTLFPELLTKAIAWDWSSNMISKTAPLTAINFWYLDFIFIVTFLATLLQYREHFATTAMSTALLNISMIISLIIYMRSEPENIVIALSISVLVGGFMQVLAHLIAIKKLNLHKILIGGWKYRKKKDVKKEEMNFRKLFFPSIWGNSVPQISAFLDTILASYLITGSISYLYFANRVFQLPLAIIAIATSVALFPMISKAINRGNEREAYKNLEKAFWLLFTLLSLATIMGIILSEPIVWLLLERGEFSKANTVQTASVLSMYMLGLIPHGLTKLFAMFLYANQKHKKAAKIATIALALNIIVSIILMNLMGVMGLALAGSIGGLILFGLTVREVGIQHFLKIINSPKRLIYLCLTLISFGLILNYTNQLLLEWIR